jgi:hypothetical protein
MMEKVMKRDEYGRPIEYSGSFDERSRKAYEMMPRMKPIKIGRHIWCSDCGSFLMTSWNCCPHCLSRIERAEINESNTCD